MTKDLESISDGLSYCRRQTAELQRKVAQFSGANFTLEIKYTRAAPTPENPMNATEAALVTQPSVLPGLPRPPYPIFRSGEIWAQLKSEIPDDLGRDTGAIMNELRAQLDHLANILARRNGANEDSSSWPVLSTRDNLRDAKRQTRRLSEADQEAVLNLQPYNHRRLEVLSKLHLGDIVRKHRRPLGLRAQAGIGVGGEGYVGVIAGHQSPLFAEPGEPRMPFYFEDVTARLATGVDASFLDPPELRGLDTIDFLLESATAIASIVHQFSRARG